MIVDAVVMAAGESARLGRAKQLMLFDGQTLLARAVAAVRGSTPRRLLVVLGARAAEIGATMSDGEIVHNPDWRTGLGSSIRAALTRIDADAAPPDGLLLAACDQPLVPAAHFAQLRRVFETNPAAIVATAYDDTAGVPALFPRALFAALAALPAGAGARQLLSRHSDHLATVGCPEAARDVDTPEDYRLLLSRRDR